MADWQSSALTTTTAYATVISVIVGRLEDAATMAQSPSNPPTGYVRWNTSLNKFQRWDGATWVDMVLALAGGGTGATSAATARTALGIQSMGLQDAGSVAITGGTIAGITAITLSAALRFSTDQAYDIGEATKQVRYGYFKGGLVLPVGNDKWVPA